MRPAGIVLVLLVALAVALLAASNARAAASTWTLVNPTNRPYQDGPVRLKVDLPATARQGRYVVTAGGEKVACQIELLEGAARAWVLATVEAGGRIEYRVERGRPARPDPAVQVRREGGSHILDNGLVAVRVPAAAEGAAPGPIEAVRLPGGKWLGGSTWHLERPLKRFTSTVTGDGTVFGKVRLQYEFEGSAGIDGQTAAFTTIDIALYPGQRHVTIEESHEMSRGEHWEFDCARGWGARKAICIPHSGGFGRPDFGAWPPDSLATGQTRMGDTLLNLMPRWTQAYDEGWLFAAHDGTNAVGVAVCHAGRWLWPHDNMIEIKVRDSADFAGLRCPVQRGSRYWFLLAGPVATWEGKAAKDYIKRHAFESLDKLQHDYVLEWPGLEKLLAGGKKKPKLGGFSGVDFFSGGVNPTGGWRGYGRRAVREAGRQGNLSDLTRVQVIFDPDCYGEYWNFWSPENPNFFTDFIKPGIALTTKLKRHPRFAELAKLAEHKFREDVYHSVTLPGGAGQECPGYLAHAMKSWKALAPICREHLGFDPAKWPRFKAGASFLVHASQPAGEGARKCHPGGDTHPPGPDVMKLAEEWGVREDVRGFTTEELPGFGVIFRSKPGTARETYLAFKAGPNRGHFHGDQLSFHYCANAKPVAIDHMCSYSPRAGQEHMHNRLAFHTDRLPWANMDGHERLIAFKTSGEVDVAVGQVESERLRVTEKLPPEKWDWYLPEQRFDTPLRYRRTIVSVRGGGGEDYFVVRDQYDGPRVKVSYCLHVLSGRCERSGQTFDFGNMTLFCAAPKQFTYEPFDWSHERKDKKTGDVWFRESTKGIRLTVEGRRSEFVTVLYPGRAPALSAIPGGVRVGGDEITFAGGIDDGDAATYVTVTRGGRELLRLTGSDIDMDRSQGRVGLFVPDAGYPFGEIPVWLIRQRAGRPEWYHEVIRNRRALTK